MSKITFIFSLFKKEQIKQQNMTQESVSFAEVSTYVRQKLSSFFSSSNISISRLPWIKGQSAFFVWCRTTSHNVTTQHQRSRAEHNIDMHWPCPCHILQYFYICNLFTCPFVYHLNRYHLCCCLLPFNATIFYWNTLYFIFFRILYEVAVI